MSYHPQSGIRRLAVRITAVTVTFSLPPHYIGERTKGEALISCMDIVLRILDPSEVEEGETPERPMVPYGTKKGCTPKLFRSSTHEELHTSRRHPP